MRGRAESSYRKAVLSWQRKVRAALALSAPVAGAASLAGSAPIVGPASSQSAAPVVATPAVESARVSEEISGRSP